MLDFEKCRFDDAEIVKIIVDIEDLVILYKDWREEEVTLRFKFVVGYQWFSPEGRSLSHGVVELDDAFLQLACEMADEDSIEGLKVFSFVSAWGDAKILRIVAREVVMEV